MMARARRPVEDAKHGPDFGPTVRRAPSTLPPLPSEALPPAELRKSREAYLTAYEARDRRRIVAKEDRLDPELLHVGLVRGGRVFDPLLFMFNHRVISKKQYQAAETFRDDVGLANGARMDQPDDAGVRVAPSNRNWPSDDQLEAMQRVSSFWDTLAPREQRIANAIVIEHRSLDAFALAEGMRRAYAPKLLQTVLDALVAWERQRADGWEDKP